MLLYKYDIRIYKYNQAREWRHTEIAQPLLAQPWIEMSCKDSERKQLKGANR